MKLTQSLLEATQAKLDAKLNPIIDALPDSSIKEAVKADLNHVKATVTGTVNQLQSEGREKAAEQLLKQITKSDLPEMPAWQARSSIAIALTAIIGIGQFFGYDVNSILVSLGFESADAAAGDISLFLMFVLVGWAWLERKAPKYKLVLRMFK